MKHALGDGAELAHELQALKNAGRTVGEITSAMAAANATMLKLPTTTLSDNLKVLNETTGAFGDFQHALDNLTFNTRIGSMLQNTVGAKAGDPGEMFNSLVRAFEIRGTAADHHTYQKEVGELYKSMVFTRGNVNPHEFLNFAQQANPAIKNYSERFLTKIAPSLIQEFGGERAGTRAGAWYNAIMGKTRDKRMADAWTKLGLLNDKDVLKNKKNGEIIGWNPGAIKGTDTAMSDPLEWTEKYLVPALEKAGIDSSDQKSVTKELGKLFRNSEANRFANAITQLRDRRRLHKDEGLINAVPEAEKAYDDTIENDPKFAGMAIKAALKNIGESLTNPLMKPIAHMLTGIARALNKVSAVFLKHPGLAKAVSGVVAALTGFAAIRLASFVFGLTGLGRAIGLLALAAPIGLAGRLIGVAKGVAALAVASAVGAIGRLRLLAAGLTALYAVAGGRALFGAAAISGARGFGLALAALLVPVRLLAGALRLLRFALIGSGIGAALFAIGAAGAFVYKNWSGLQKAFVTFKAGFMAALGPETQSALKPVIGLISQISQAFDDLSRKRSDGTLMMWGFKLGRGLGQAVESLKALAPAFEAAASAWKAFSSYVKTGDGDLWANTKREFEWWWNLPTKIAETATQFATSVKGLAQGGYDALVKFEWGNAGADLIDKIVDGITKATGRLTSALTRAVSKAWNKAKSAIGLGSGTDADEKQSSPPGRALGGPVMRNKTYLVGERGPELFRAGASGRIETNRTLNNLADNWKAPAGKGGTWHDSVMRAEGTAGPDPYNVVLGNGRYGLPQKPLTDMTLREAYAFGRTVRARHGSSSALGAFQIVGRTMKDAAKGTGLGWDDKFDPDNQRTMADWIRRNQGFGAWEGFKRHPAELAAARAGAPVASAVGGSAEKAGALTKASLPGLAAAGRVGEAADAPKVGGKGGGGGGGHALASHAARLASASKGMTAATARRTSTTVKRGDLTVNVKIESTGSNAEEIAAVARREIMAVLRQYETQQSASLSD